MALRFLDRLVLPAALLAAALSWNATPAAAADSVLANDNHPGKSIYRNAGCMNCHKWHGMGGSGYGGTPINLRDDYLTADQIKEVIACGRPGTSMPKHIVGAYDTYECYGGLNAAELGNDMPVNARQMLAPRQLNQITAFVIEHFQAHPELSKDDCRLFFPDTQMCDRLDVDAIMSQRPSGGH